MTFTKATLHEVDARHGLQRKPRAAGCAFGGKRGNRLNQRGPLHDGIHLVGELALARSFVCQVQAKSICLIKRMVSVPLCGVKHRIGRVMQSFCRCELVQDALPVRGLARQALGEGPELSAQ